MEGDRRLRNLIETSLGGEHWDNAQRLLSRLWRAQPDLSTALYVAATRRRLDPHLTLLRKRVGIARSFTVEPVLPLLQAGAFGAGMDLSIYVGGFNTWTRDILDPASGLYAHEPDIVILATQTCDVAPDLWARHADLSRSDCQTAVSRVVESYGECIQAFRAHSQGALVVHNLAQPHMSSSGVLDYQSEGSQSAAIQEINAGLVAIAHEVEGVYILDYDGLMARHGRLRWHDERKWATARMPIAAECLNHLAEEWLRFIHPLAGKTCKALAVDLDNTLWGGVIGEDGVEGIEVGSGYPGAAYGSLQRAILDLYQRGIILAVCSKNDPETALEALARHPGMLLRPQHFGAFRINWTDKAQNLQEIVAELNIGTDALAFLDDNPAERERVRTALPEVTVIELPDDPMEYAQALRNSPVFERLSLSREDRKRGKYYGQQRERTQLRTELPSVEDFYRSLEQVVEVGPVTGGRIARVAQLTQKTNQFNTTTRRYTEQQIAEMIGSPDHCVYGLSVSDRFGDSGLVGIAVLRLCGNVCEIRTFLLSCRVIGRTVETAFLSCLVNKARAWGAEYMSGWFVPTQKNGPASAFFAEHGFAVQHRDGDSILWRFDLGRQQVNCPEWIRLRFDEGD